jgi:predicted  nucleic acid-binding Zn-ribbon protein
MAIVLRVRTPQGSKFGGIVDKDILKIFRKPSHIYYKYNGFGFNKELIDNLNKLGTIKVVRVYFADSIYEINLKEIAKSEVVKWQGEEQYIVSINKFQKIK